jgi:NADPH-dependent 2,4-dienoyl-CoA reductase/sulfur reductase-like enzyme
VHSHARVLRVEGDTRVQALVWRRENLAGAGGKAGPEQRIACDAVGFGYALRSETQLADLLGCRFQFDGLQRAHLPVRDKSTRSSVPGVYLAGDGAGIMGADAAELAGERAALALLQDRGIAVDAARVAQIEAELARIGAFRLGLERFPVPRTLGGDRSGRLVICRCENIRAGGARCRAREGAAEMNRLKALTRVGMGRCQGRMCGAAAAEIWRMPPGCRCRKWVACAARLRSSRFHWACMCPSPSRCRRA